MSEKSVSTIPNILEKKVLETYLMDILDEVVLENEEKIAVEFKNDKITYLTLQERVNQVANFLTKKGIKDQEIVGVCLEKSIEEIIYLIGILRIGAIYVALSPYYPKKRVEEILEETDSTNIISTSYLSSFFSNFKSTKILIDEVSEIVRKEPKNFERKKRFDGETTCCCFFTSGSTGFPKGVLVSSKNLTSMVLFGYIHIGLKKTDRYASYASFIFTVSLIEIFTSLLNGLTLCIIPEEIRKYPEKIFEYVNEYKITCLHTTPVIFRSLPRTGELVETHQVTTLISEGLISLIREFRENEVTVDWSCDPPVKFSVLYNLKENNLQKEELLNLIVNSFLGLGEKNFGNPVRRALGFHKNIQFFSEGISKFIDTEVKEVVFARNLKTDELVGSYYRIKFHPVLIGEKEDRTIIEELNHQCKLKVFEDGTLWKTPEDIKSPEEIWEGGIAVEGSHPSLIYKLSILGQVLARKIGCKTAYDCVTNPVTLQNLESTDCWKKYGKVEFDEFLYKGTKPLKDIVRKEILERLDEMKVNERDREALMISYVRAGSRTLDRNIEEAYGLE